MSQTFDTMAFAKALHRRGFDSKQATALAETAKEHIVDRVATKNDIDSGLERVELRMTIRVGAMLVAVVGILLAAIPLVLK